MSRNNPFINVEDLQKALQNVRGEINIINKALKTMRKQQGIQGECGERGEQGEQGPQGIQGESGEGGEQGERGSVGSQGIPGRDGRDGKNGIDGKPADASLIREELQNNPNDFSTIVRNLLELLQGDERLDKDAIKGLDELEKKIDKAQKPVRVFGGMRKIVMDDFSFSGDGSTTTFTLPAVPAGKGLAIWAYYQGQWLQPDVHFTISNKVFETTFTPADGTTIEGFLIAF